jgi:oleate hydratase
VDVSEGKSTIRGITTKDLNTNKVTNVKVTDDDRVIITTGSITAASIWGSHKEAPLTDRSFPMDFHLWKKLSEKVPNMGNVTKFISDIDLSKWVSMTCTFRDRNAFDDIFGKSGQEPLITFTTSPWLMTVSPKPPKFYTSQPDDVAVLWGYALYADKLGEFNHKPMASCNGEEFLHELLGQMGRLDLHDRIVATTTCVPAMMPYITAQFLNRKVSDRPNVVVKGATNWGMIGQFVEIPKDVVFTVEYSVHGALEAVRLLVNPKIYVPEMYEGTTDIQVITKALGKLFFHV